MSNVLTDSELAKIEKTWESDEHLEKMNHNWETFKKHCGKLQEGRRDRVMQMLDELEERIFIAPASSRVEYHNAFPGGYVDHCLRVLSNTATLAQAWKVRVDHSELIMACLFHDFGKVGTRTAEYYVRQDSNWHRKRGMFYERNIKLPNAQLGLFTLNEYGITLSKDEYYAILLNDGPAAPENAPYAMREPTLSLIVHMADRWSTQQEKGRHTLLEDLKH